MRLILNSVQDYQIFVIFQIFLKLCKKKYLFSRVKICLVYLIVPLLYNICRRRKIKLFSLHRYFTYKQIFRCLFCYLKKCKKKKKKIGPEVIKHKSDLI